MAIFYGNGDGTFQAPIQYTPFHLPGGLAVGDFNGDRLSDLAVTQNGDGHAVAVMLNQPGTAEEPPTVTGLSPATGPTAGGTVVTITGTNFIGTSQVDFGSVPAGSFRVNSNTSITATTPAEAAGTVDVTVSNAGASATSPADHFTFTAPSTRPTVTGPTPTVGPTYGGTLVRITGTNFTGATAVDFGIDSGTARVTVVVPTDVWTGLGTTNNWSDPANWSLRVVPGPTTTARFDGTSQKDAIVDPAFGGRVGSIYITSLHTGNIALGRSRNIVGTFTQGGGTFNAHGFATTVGGSTKHLAGVFYLFPSGRSPGGWGRRPKAGAPRCGGLCPWGLRRLRRLRPSHPAPTTASLACTRTQAKC